VAAVAHLDMADRALDKERVKTAKAPPLGVRLLLRWLETLD